MTDFATVYRLTRNLMAASDMSWEAALDLSISEARVVFAEEAERRKALKRGRR